MKKDLAVIVGLFLLIVVLLVFGKSFTSLNFVNQATPSSTQASGSAQARKSNGLIPISVRTLNIDAYVASKASDRKKGLAKRDSLPLNGGMLFVFETKGPYIFWMKDMKFAIDIIWIDENRRIVDMISNVPAEPGKNDKNLKRYGPRGDALYVLEINAGLANLNGLAVGDQVNFQL